jgi:hypothetical protein
MRIARYFQPAGMLCLFFGLAACAPTSLQTAALTPPPAALASPQSLMGSTPAVLSAEFGTPILRRVDGTAQVWLYHSDVCALNLILYPDHAGTPRVTMAVPDNGNPASCMASLQHSITAAALERPPTS